MSIERCERLMFRALDNAVFEVESAVDHLEDSLHMSYGAKGAELQLELIDLTGTIGELSLRLRKYTQGELV